MNLKRIIGGIVLAAMASVVVYAAKALLTDAPAMAAALRSFPIGTLGLMLTLGLGCFTIRAARWGQLMRLVGHPVRYRDALYLQLAGQTMSVSPGRLGEVLKPWIARSVGGLPMTKGVALVFSERVSDLIAVCILSLGGASVIGGKGWVLGLGLAVIAAGTWLASSQWFHDLALRLIERQSWARKHHASASAIAETIQLALTWRTLLSRAPRYDPTRCPVCQAPLVQTRYFAPSRDPPPEINP